MGRSSRAKGVAGERESADVFRAAGGVVTQVQNNVAETIDYLVRFEPVTLAVDTKRRERFEHVTASKAIEAAVSNGELPCVVWRPNREPWRVTTLLDPFLAILAGET